MPPPQKKRSKFRVTFGNIILYLFQNCIMTVLISVQLIIFQATQMNQMPEGEYAKYCDKCSR